MSLRRAALAPVLVIEDDPVLRKAICGALEDAGFDVIGCADLASARVAIERARPDGVILDLSLEGEFGADLLSELASDDDAPAVVVCSAFGLASLVAARYSVPCVAKPFDLDHLIVEVERAIAERLRPKAIRTA